MPTLTRPCKRIAILLAPWLSFSSTASVVIAFSSFSVWAGEPSPTTSIPTLIEAIHLSSESAILTQRSPDNTPDGTSELQSEPSQPDPAAETSTTSTTPENRWQFSVQPYLTEAIHLSSESAILTQRSPDNTPDGTSELQSEPSQPDPAAETSPASTTPENRWQFSVQPYLTEAIHLSSESAILTQRSPDNIPDGTSELQSEPSQPDPAAETSPASTTPENRWQFSVQPYLFVPFDVDADITVRGRSASIEAGFSDIFDLDRIFAASLRLEARRNRLGFIIDGSYLSIGRDGNLDVTLPAEFVQRYGINTDVNVNAEVSVDAHQGVLDLAAFYRVVDTSLGDNDTESNPFPRLVVEPILGLRMNWLGQEVDINATRVGRIDIPDRDVELSAFFVEPMLGTRIGLELSERWAVGIRGDVSGFGINADRNVAWNLFLGSQYRLSRTTALQLAYRLNKFEYQDGEGTDRLGLDLQQQGLWLGLLFRF